MKIFVHACAWSLGNIAVAYFGWGSMAIAQPVALNLMAFGIWAGFFRRNPKR
jgi:hypothetical protein